MQELNALLLFIGIAIAALALGLVVGYFVARSGEGIRSGGKKEKRTGWRKESAQHEERTKHQSLYHLISVLSSSLKYQRVLETALDMSGDILCSNHEEAAKLVSAVLLFSEDGGREASLRVGYARRFTSADSRLTLPGNQGVLAEVVETGERVAVQNISTDPELKRVIALQVCRSGYCFPLRVGLNTYGVMLFAHPDEDFFDEERREILRIVEEQAVIALQNARLYENLEKEKERMMEIQEEARKKLARDLHDGPTQTIAAIAMRVNFARRLMEKDTASTVEELLKIEDMARRTTQEIRHMLFTLRPLVLESQGLVAALEAMAEKMNETYHQNVVVIADESKLPEMETSKQTVIFYIVEEAVNNARKHAQAVEICVRLKPVEKDLILVEVEDNGVGFNVNAMDAIYDKRGSLGMVNMRERAELVNGILHVSSEEGKGTRVQVVIPLTEQAVDRMRSGL